MQQVSRMRTRIENTLAHYEWPTRPKALVAVGSAVAGLASMELGLPQQAPEKLHGMKLSRGLLRKWMDRILESSPSQRRSLSSSRSLI